MKVVIIGGGSAGTTCAFELRKLNKDVNITILESTSFYEYSPCALPYVISGEISSLDNIFIYDKKDYESNNIDLSLNSKVTSVDFDDKVVNYKKDNSDLNISYDKLVIATGARPFVPNVEGLDEHLTLKNPSDVKSIEEELSKSDKFLVVGGGMVGVEVAEALNKKGKDVTIMESSTHLLSSMLDKDMSKILKEDFEKLGIKVIENERLSKYDKSYGKVIFCTGAISNDFLDINKDNGYIVDDNLKSNIEDVYACGDVSYSKNMILNKNFKSGLGTTAVRQGMIAARNVLGYSENMPKVLNNTISKVGDLYIGSIGLSSDECNKNDLKFTTSKASTPVRSSYYSKDEFITVKLIISLDYKILGAQIIGNSEVVGRMNMLSLAMTKDVDVKELSKLETCYNPASAPIFDPVTLASNVAIKKVDAILKRGV